MQTLNAIIGAQPQPIASSYPQVPAQLEQIIFKCLEKAPEERYQSARELREDLKKVQKQITDNKL